ncbi:hypothetical protein [Roseimicrobium gellanilyticum]|uniref:hypothetical protein n=1 Tax=Roseimicrobium gellanilyticum TaxID=748857 RepID=UPI001B85C791|nr:hypothetical protein [Roseimicrobium gellanilyticum]
MALPLPFLGAQTTAAPAAKPKVKMVPRALPGMGPRTQSGPTSEDIQDAESNARSKVPLFRPAAVRPTGNSQVQVPSASASVNQDPDRARIVLIRRKGTFPIPQSSASEAPVLVNDSTSRPVSAEPVPAALPPGKIRVIPKESIKLGTPASHP